MSQLSVLTAPNLAPGHVIEPDAAETVLRDLYRPQDGPSLRASMVTTVDGGATGAHGRSGDINTPADVRVFRVIRSLADVIVVGAGTARTEQYRGVPLAQELRAARRDAGQSECPRLAIVGSGANLAQFAAVDPTPLIAIPAQSPHRDDVRQLFGAEAVIELPAAKGRVDVRALRSALIEAGLVRMVCEGGPHLLGQLCESGVVDELCCTIAPRLVGGDGPRIVEAGWLDVPLDLTHLLVAEDALLGRWRTRGGANT